MPIFVGHNSNRIVNESMAQMENSEGTRVGRMTRFASFRTRITAHKIENPDVGSPLWKFLEDNDSSKAAWWWSILSICVIAINSVSFVVESQPNFCCGNYTLIWDIINWVCLGFFTIEYGLRFYSCPLSYGLTGPRMREAAVYDQMKETGKYKSAIFWQFLVRSRIRFFLNFQNLIDITAILPFYVQLMLTNPGPGLRFIRVIRIVRIFRLLKIGKYSKGLKLLMNTMKKSMKALSSLALVMILLVVIMSTIIWMLERGVWCDESNNYCSGSGVDEEGNFTAGWYYYVGAFQGSTYSEGCSTAPYCRQPSKFTSIFPSTYWTLTTITTTGYGDMYPHTPTGKVLGCIVMLAGLLLLALPVTVISGNFATEYASEELIRLVKEEKKQKQLEEIQRWEQEFDHSMSQAPASFARYCHSPSLLLPLLFLTVNATGATACSPCP
uniref:Ion transport domain-containing protein n=1 Tax=Guillardia theta TaxID=55529 RepID=A0A7S4PNR5_GUITH|mmetsp:Transcript_779/g.2336  ORF Transcript_779/g.2336 Transcript_779/m.2336 type:complete len:440 (+) Transcript_779:343-1662(+)